MDKDPTTFSVITYAWVLFISTLGGLVSYFRKVREGEVRPWNFTEFIGELVTSGFVGMLTFWLCQAAGINDLVAAALVGISGHMGSRAIFMMEKLIEKRVKEIQ